MDAEADVEKEIPLIFSIVLAAELKIESATLHRRGAKQVWQPDMVGEDRDPRPRTSESVAWGSKDKEESPSLACGVLA